MKTLYFECNMGAAGDMLTAALLELVPDKQAFVDKLNAIGLDGVTFKAESAQKCGITGTHVSVVINGEEERAHDVDLSAAGDSHSHGHTHEEQHNHDHAAMHMHDEHTHSHTHEHDEEHHHAHTHDHGDAHTHTHHHSGLHDIKHIVSRLNVSDKVRADVLAVYSIIAEAESAVHGKDISGIHFHEVGTMDAVADVTAVCMLIEAIAPDEILASPIHVGSGNVKCAHGVLPVPAPATERILRGVPIYSGSIKGELCTPTGAALLKHFVKSFGAMPVMSIEKTGYGMGNKNFDAANCVRAILGEKEGGTDTVLCLNCNVDDMTPEAVGYAQSKLFDAGAADVFVTPIYMKKNRPAFMISCICRPENKDALVKAIFKHTTTIGIRETACDRYVLNRTVKTVETKHGAVRIKSSEGYGVKRSKPEFDDLAALADAAGISIADIKAIVKKELD